LSSIFTNYITHMNKLIKQPLLHFFLAGALIFAAYQFSDQPAIKSDISESEIVVDRITLLNFMQFRAQAFQPELFSEQLDAMSEAELDSLVADFVREEALYREALLMGMDQGDYIIRQRMVQKVEFLLENMVNQALDPQEEQILEFYSARMADYQVDNVYTFTHIFFDGGERGWEMAEQDANILLNSPLIGEIAFNDAAQYGDRYPFLQNYVERTRDFVVNNFIDEFVNQLDILLPSEQSWYGPFESRYGFHLVMLRTRSEAFIPELDDIRGRVIDDWRYETVLENRKEAEDQVINAYEVRLNLQAGH
jgi:parvulin-like peptidyl-prolyl isomerase